MTDEVLGGQGILLKGRLLAYDAIALNETAIRRGIEAVERNRVHA